MIRRIGLASLAVVAVTAIAGAMASQYQDKWAAEKKDPRFADVDWAFNQDTPINDHDAPMGAGLYSRFCIQCHGALGDGEGELAPFLVPPPRNFTKGVFKGRSSHPDLPPCATDLMRSLVHGLPLSAMLSYSFMMTGEMQALVAYVKSLAAGHFPKGFGRPLKSGNFHRGLRMPLPTAETIARGRALFDRFSCVACHGVNGDSKGEVAKTLSDTADGRPSSVRDFTQGIYSGGPNVRHMYLRISGGVQGTVMPPFATSGSVEDRWALAQFVASLNKREGTLPLPHHEKLLVKKIAALPKGPADPAWAALKDLKVKEELHLEGYPITLFYVLPIYLQQTRLSPDRPYFTPAWVSAYHDGASISFLVEWMDTKSEKGDRVEIQLSPENKYGFVLHGSVADPVNLWRWDAAAPGAATEWDAEGPFAVTAQAASDVTATGTYDAAKKKWSVMFTRALAGTAGKDPKFEIGPEYPVLFLMRDASDTWPDTRRPIVADPGADPAEAKEAKEREDQRKKDEAAVHAKFGELPRHLTTWHRFKLEE